MANWQSISSQILPTMQATQIDPWVRKIPWRREWLATPVFMPGESHGQGSLAGCSSDRTDRLHYYYHLTGIAILAQACRGHHTSQATAFRTRQLGSEASCPLLQLGTESMEVAPLHCRAPPRKQGRTSGDPRGRNKSENLWWDLFHLLQMLLKQKGVELRSGEEAGRKKGSCVLMLEMPPSLWRDR